MNLIYIKEIKEDLFIYAESIILKGIELGNSVYNLACLFSLKKNKPKALELLNQSLEKKETTIIHVEEDEDWEYYKNDEDFINLLNKYRKQ